MGEVWGLKGHELVSDLCPTNSWLMPLSKFLASGSFPTTKSPALGGCGVVVRDHMWDGCDSAPSAEGSTVVVLLPTPSPFVLCGRGRGGGEDPGVGQLGRPGGSGLVGASRHPACLLHLSLWQLLAGFWG